MPMPSTPAPTDQEESVRRVERVASVIARAAGLARAGERSDFLTRRVAGLVDAQGVVAVDDLLRRAELGETAAIGELRNALSVNYTYFWREPEHFQILLEHAITSLRKKAGASPRPALRFWSAACASGEEAWSMAIVAAEARRLTGIDAAIDIVASDIDTAALEEARRGQYSDEVMQQLPQELRQRYLQPLAQKASPCWQVSDALRSLVHFAPLDLLATQWPLCENGDPFDVIFCRNVMIYLSDSARLHVFEKFSSLLAKDGLLFLSRVEGGINRAEPYFRPCGDSVYLLGAAARRTGVEGKRQ